MLSVAAVPTSVRAALTLPWLTSVISYIVFFFDTERETQFDIDAGRGEERKRERKGQKGDQQAKIHLPSAASTLLATTSFSLSAVFWSELATVFAPTAFATLAPAVGTALRTSPPAFLSKSF